MTCRLDVFFKLDCFLRFPAAEASIEELKELASLVSCGRPYDVQAWLADGKPFRTTARTRVSPILDSVHTGFHSMVEAFLSAGLKSQELSEMLSEAVRSHCEDLVSLLIEHWAVRFVVFEDTL
jgi:hypothetical protein